jgi:hypothetical protein
MASSGYIKSMALLRFRPAFRRFALTLAAAQLLAYASAPVVEALTDRTPGPVSIESGHSKACVQIHQESTCMACQLLTLTAHRGQAATVPCTDSQRAVFIQLAASASPRAPPQGPLSRAPPSLA